MAQALSHSAARHAPTHRSNCSAPSPTIVARDSCCRGRWSDSGKARRNADAGSSPRREKGFFAQSQLSVQTLSRCPHSPSVQSHASTSVRALKKKNPKHWQPYCCLYRHTKKTPHSLVTVGSAALAAVCLSRVRRPEFPARDNEALKANSH